MRFATVELNNLLEKMTSQDIVPGRTAEELQAEIKFERESGLMSNLNLPEDLTFVDFMESFEGEDANVYSV